jgi:hypothetical protein
MACGTIGKGEGTRPGPHTSQAAGAEGGRQSKGGF